MQIWPGLVCILVIYLLFSLTFILPCANWACCRTQIPKCGKAIVIKGEENGPGSFLVAILTEVQFSSVVQLCLNLCDPMDCSTPGFPVHHQLSELAQTHAHWVTDAIQPYHPLLSPSPPDFNLPASRSFPMSQFFASDGQSIGVSPSAWVLPMNIQDWFPLGLNG